MHRNTGDTHDRKIGCRLKELFNTLKEIGVVGSFPFSEEPAVKLLGHAEGALFLNSLRNFPAVLHSGFINL